MFNSILDFFSCVHVGYVLGGFNWPRFKNGFLLARNLFRIARQFEEKPGKSDT